MKNITEILKKATSEDINWKHSIFYTTIDLLNNNSVKISFWDNEENWASIIEDKKIKGYIWKKYPLVIYEKDILLDVVNLLSDIKNIYYIKVDSLSKDLFKIEEVVSH